MAVPSSFTPPIWISVGPMKHRQASLVTYHPLRAPSRVAVFSVLSVKPNPELLPTLLPNPCDLWNSCPIIIHLPYIPLLSWTLALLPWHHWNNPPGDIRPPGDFTWRLFLCLPLSFLYSQKVLWTSVAIVTQNMSLLECSSHLPKDLELLMITTSFMQILWRGNSSLSPLIDVSSILSPRVWFVISFFAVFFDEHKLLTSMWLNPSIIYS